MRMGQGFDAHRFSPERLLVLGGVTIDHPQGLVGDSDGDVLTHAIIDALLGALTLGDIGTWFRAADPGVMGARSLDLLTRVVHMVHERSFVVVHIDATVVGEEPKVRPHVPQMRTILAQVLAVPDSEISIKGTTTDRMGWLGRGEGIAALALAQLEGNSGLGIG